MYDHPLKRLPAVLQSRIDQGHFPGAVALVHHRGHDVLFQALGRQTPAADSPPMARDTVFRIYSMTKPIVSLATLMLMEQGQLLLAHPVSRYLPAFAGQRVLQADGSTAPTPREATLHDLLRHTAGLSYAWEAGPVPELYRAARIGSRRLRNAELAAALGPIPLVRAPGTAWEYSRATDVLGAVLEAVAGEPLGPLLQRLVFEPLGMHETGFHVPPQRAHRLAEPYAQAPGAGGAEVKLIDVGSAPAFESGGGGLVSTATDYARFLRLMLAGGTLDGVRLASRATIAYMTADHLGPLPAVGNLLPPSHGFGLGVAVRRATGLGTHPASAGQYGWSGLGGTLFFVDPAEELFALLLTQAPSQLQELCELYPALVYAAL